MIEEIVSLQMPVMRKKEYLNMQKITPKTVDLTKRT